MESKIVIQFNRFGPYHLARITAAYEALSPYGIEVVGLEISGEDHTYEWRKETGEQTWSRDIVFPDVSADLLSSAQVKEGVFKMLDQYQPTVVAIPGWGYTASRASLAWCKKRGAKAILMSETREADGRRVWWKEWVKGRIVRQFDAALVGSASHRDYLVKLGLAVEKIQLGYNVVDNAYFVEECQKVRRSKVEGQKTPPYFLASNRFIERKNLARLIKAYAEYAHSKFKIQNSKFPTWDLCLLGDGELKTDLMSQCLDLGLHVEECAPWEILETENLKLNTPAISPSVFFPGFRQIDELPRFYAHAGCFVHPALEEPWGLVINEAMASGLPILSSYNVAAAEELIDEGVNGYRFDPQSEKEMAESLMKIATLGDLWTDYAEASKRILEERCPTSAFGRGLYGILNQKS